MSCIDATDLKPDSCGAIHSPGTKRKIYYAFVRDIETFPAPKSNPTEPKDKVILLGDYVMKSGKYFHSITCHLNENTFQNEFMGERGSGNFQNRGEFAFLGNSDEATGLMSLLAREEVVVIVPLNTGAMAVIGSEDHPAFVKPLFDSLTDEATEFLGWKFNILSVDTQPWRLSSVSIIPLDPGEGE